LALLEFHWLRPEAAQNLLGVILGCLSSLDGIDAQYQEILQQAQAGGPENLLTRENKLNRVEEEIEREGEKIQKTDQRSREY